MNCDRCRNKDICKFEDEARNFELGINNLPHPEVTSGYVTCKKFISNVNPEVVKKKISKELKDGKSVADVAEQFGISESKVRFISRPKDFNKK